MAATYSFISREKNHEGKLVVNATISYVNEPYNNGLTVTKEQLGFRNVIESLIVYDQGGGFAGRFGAGKIQLYQQDPGVPGATELSPVTGNQTVSVKVIAVGW